MAEAGVVVDYQSIRRTWRNAEEGAFWVTFRVPSERRDDELFDIVSDCEEGQWDLMVEFLTRGPKGFVGMVSGFADVVELDALFTIIGEQLSAAGFTGTIVGTTSAKMPRWYDLDLTPELAAIIAWTIDLDAMGRDSHRTSSWS
jgi:hypothetical protein